MKLSLLGFLVACVAASAASASQSYPMICRGGGTLSVNNALTATPTKTSLVMQSSADVFFTKSAKAAGAQGENLSPGECSWVDRPINNSEPSALSDSPYVEMAVTTQNSSGREITRVGSLYSALQTTPTYFVLLYVSNDGAGPFVRDNSKPVKTFQKP